jgi:hypothetical protein
MSTSLPRRASAACVVSLLSAAASAQAPLYSIAGPDDWARAGSAVAVMPDLDGDGTPEFVVGTPFEAPAGAVRIYSGATGAVLRTYVGEVPGAEFGASIAVLDDIDGRGHRDLLIGAPGTTFSKQQQGTVYVQPVEVAPWHTAFFGSMVGDRLGSCVANVGDLDGDGKEEFAFSATGADIGSSPDVGRVNIYTWGPMTSLGGTTGSTPGARFGASIAAGDDYNGDGRKEVLVGAPGYSTASNAQIGRVSIVDVGVTLTEIGHRIGTQSYEYLGSSLVSLGDLDGDGAPHFAAGSPGYNGANYDDGRVQWFEGLSGAAQQQAIGAGGWEVGAALAYFDWDGDGARELLTGAPKFLVTGVGELGAVRVHHAGTGALEATLLGWRDGSGYGAALAGGLDFNGDGALELVVGAPLEDLGGNTTGCARLLLADTAKPYRYCSPKVNSAGCTPQISWTGGASLTLGDNLHITANNVLAQRAGMLFWGTAQASLPFGGGTICVAQPVRRTPVQFSNGSSGCWGAYDFHFTQAEMLAAGLTAGARIYAQYWSRDPGFAAPNNIGLTAGLAVDLAP